MLLLRFRVSTGWVDLDIMEMTGQDVFGLYNYFSLGFYERRIQYVHVGPSIIVRVMQCQHGGIPLRLVWGIGISGLGRSSYQ